MLSLLLLWNVGAQQVNNVILKMPFNPLEGTFLFYARVRVCARAPTCMCYVYEVLAEARSIKVLETAISVHCQVSYPQYWGLRVYTASLICRHTGLLDRKLFSLEQQVCPLKTLECLR